MEPFTLLTFLVTARNRMNNFEGRAPTGENPFDNDRPMRITLPYVQLMK